jgi:hypothetical protein
MNPARSTPTANPRLKSLTLRLEEHAKGEVFTLEQMYGDGRITTASRILYLDGKPRSFEDARCSGTRSARRVDSQTVEILRMCASGETTKFVRHLARQGMELILEITEQRSGGRRFERRLVLEKQEERRRNQ